MKSHETFQPLPSGFRQVSFNDVDALAAAMDERVAAVMLEAVQGEGGVVPASPEYLRAVRQLCDEREALLIVDEVQCGLGRTGTWFAFEHAGIEPDIVTMAKALGSGVPIGACWARADVASSQITLNGRDSHIIVANYKLGTNQMQYSTSEIMTNATIGNQDVAVLYGDAGTDGETVLRYATKPDVTVSGGNDRTTFYLSGDYNHDQGVIVGPSNVYTEAYQ